MKDVRDILRRFQGVRKSGSGWAARCPAHDDRRASLSISVDDGGGKVLVYCHAGCKPEEICRAARIELRDLFLDDSRAEKRSGKVARTIVARYDYLDEGGLLVFRVLRFDPKGFSQRRPDGQGGWIDNLDGVRRIPYRLPEVIAAQQVLVVEGEKDVETARSLGFVATCNPGGAGKWRSEYSQFLAGKQVVVIPDNDEPGRKHVQQILLSLHGKASLKLVKLPAGKDLSEWVELDGTREQLLEQICIAPEWTPPAPEDGSALLKDIVAFIRTYVILSEAQAVVSGLWILHTHAFEAAENTPYLQICSAEKQSGKTRLLEVLEPLILNPWLTGRVTAAVLARKIDAQSPTLLLDETDAAFGGDEEYSETLRSVLNTGHRRGGVASCCVGQGLNIGFKDFNTFCPKALAGIGKLPDTIADRSIPIRLERRARSEVVTRFRRRKVTGAGRMFYERAAAWAQQHVPALKNAEPDLPDELSDRQQDCAEPLVVIADTLGGDWPERARSALLELFKTGQQEQSRGVELLKDIQVIFDEQVTDRLASETLVQKLVEIETSPWGEWNRGKGLTKIQLARLLRPFEIAPRTIRLEAGGTARGYHRDQFSEAWERYLPCAPLLSPVLETSQASQASIDAGPRASADSSQAVAVTDRESQDSPVFMRDVTEVTDQLTRGEQSPVRQPTNWYRPEPLPEGGWRCECGAIITDPADWFRHCGAGGCPLRRCS